MALLSIRKLHKQYGSVTAIQSLDLDLEKGEVIVLLGPSGCGKSTLLRCVNGLEPHQGGSIVMDGIGEFGKDVSWQTARQKVGNHRRTRPRNGARSLGSGFGTRPRRDEHADCYP